MLSGRYPPWWLIPAAIAGFLLLPGTGVEDPYPEISFADIDCNENVNAVELVMIFDQSGSLGENDPQNRRFEEARAVSDWWKTASCSPNDRIAVLHFDDAIPPYAPTLVGEAVLGGQLMPASSSSGVSPSLSTAMNWAAERPTSDLVIIFTDGINPDVTEGLMELEKYPDASVLFVSLGQPLPADWRSPLLDQVVALDKNPVLGSIGVVIAESIDRLLLEAR